MESRTFMSGFGDITLKALYFIKVDVLIFIASQLRSISGPLIASYSFILVASANGCHHSVTRV